jgi:uncharacterized protein
MLLQRYIQATLTRPWTLLTLAVLAAAALSAGTAHLGFRADERVFFSAANPKLQALDAFHKRYGKEDNLIVVAHARQGDLFQPAHIKAIANLVDRLWALDHVKRVDAITNFDAVTGDAEGMVVDHLWRRGDPTDPATLAKMRATAERMPLAEGQLISKDGKTGIVAAGFRLPTQGSDAAAAAALAQVRALTATVAKADPGLELHITGSIALDRAFAEASASDGMLLIPIMFTLLLLMLGLLLWSWVPVLAAFLVVGGAIGAALGIAGLVGIPLSSVSASSPYIITIVAFADTVHFAFAASAARRAGAGPREAVAGALKKTAMPILMTSVTTAAGFFSLAFADVPPFAHLGIISGLGAVLAWALTMLMVPPMMLILPWKPAPSLDRFSGTLGALGRWTAHHPRKAIALTLGPALLLSAFVGSNVLDDRYVRYFDHRFAFRVDTDALNRDLGGFYKLEYDLKADGYGSISNPEYLRDVDRFADWLRAQPGVTHVSAQPDIIKMIHRGLYGGGDDAYSLPDTEAAAAQLLALYEMQLPFGHDLREQIVLDRSASRLSVSLGDLSTKEMIALDHAASGWLARNAPRLAGSAPATGTSIMFAYIGQRNIQSMVLGSITGFAAITLFLFFSFRSVKLTAIGFVANVTPVLAALGAWGLVVGEVGMAVAAIAVVTMGIVVDDTIHLLTSLRRREDQDDPVELVTEVMAESGPGVVATTLCLSAGFFVLASSGFQINAWLGLMTGIIALFALVFDLLFVPAAFALLARRPAQVLSPALS